MAAKITLTLEQDEQRGTNEAMEETIKLLGTLETMPMMKVVLTLECEEVIAERYREKLRLGLKRRPIGIIAKIKSTSEEQIIVVPQTTPMDKHFGDMDGVTLSSGSKTVTLTAETARKAEQMLRGSGAHPDHVTAPQAGDELFEDEV